MDSAAEMPYMPHCLSYFADGRSNFSLLLDLRYTILAALVDNGDSLRY